jgi:multiple sugar transport system substrate-binding protein
LIKLTSKKTARFGVTSLVAIAAASMAFAAPAQADDIVLDFPSFQHDEASTSAWWRNVIADFEARNPGVKVNFSNSPGSRHSDLLATRFAANTPPDILHMISRNFVGFAAQGWFAEIESCFADDTLSEFGGLQSYMEWNGQTQGLLLNSYAYHLFYNKEILDAAGVAVPTTLEELVAAVEKIDAMGEDYVGFAGVTKSEGDAFLQASMFVTGSGLTWIKDGKYNLTSPEVIEVLEKFRKIHENAPQGAGEMERNEFYFNGSAAMLLDGNYFWQQTLDEADPSVVDHVGIALAPFSVQPGSVSNSLHIPASATPEKRALVCDFIATAARADFQQQYGDALSVPPPRDGATTDALKAKFPEQVAIMIEGKSEAASVLPNSQKVMESYGLWTKLVADAVVEMFATDRTTLEIFTDLQNRLEIEIPLN